MTSQCGAYATCMYVHTYVHTYICTYIHVHTYIYICIHMYTYYTYHDTFSRVCIHIDKFMRWSYPSTTHHRESRMRFLFSCSKQPQQTHPRDKRCLRSQQSQGEWGLRTPKQKALTSQQALRSAFKINTNSTLNMYLLIRPKGFPWVPLAQFSPRFTQCVPGSPAAFEWPESSTPIRNEGG